ncbi:N-acetyl-1-D-myo-inositol-2-amino-2-deoxy-alpha-D-glucopyranoside deacetylase [Nigerium massiliense]|uniref:N-acetyl-1-D-myo-inositol-2-amino-2-deoxy-alpha- D-glucopyranoside deacetylase n=1 Tax=Nigerium massiliense TaxID=1522317 RepID=UPI00058C97C3|nr:N-acetyl-1-D-myo-inositol-2-amino-2-deoxy-alpha-D-glucopyranoside deacetylase [Nigerium massiliense]
MTDTKRLLIVHAHPDDESSQSAGTMARYVDEGAQVTLVTCTLGEMGEILVPEWQNFSPSELGQHRIGELEQAMTVLGVTDHVWLGGAGAYHDSGMTRDEQGNVVPEQERPEGAFWDADLLEAANHLVEVIRDRRPHVVSTYDPNGNYGHPDHIQAHRVTMYAVALAGAPAHRPDLGDPWQVPRVLWSTNNAKLWEQAYYVARDRGLNVFGDLSEEDVKRLGPQDVTIAAVVPYGENLSKATQALLSYRSQVSEDADFWQFFQIMRELEGSGEAYLYVAGIPFPPSDAPADDLFAGLDLG